MTKSFNGWWWSFSSLVGKCSGVNRVWQVWYPWEFHCGGAAFLSKYQDSSSSGMVWGHSLHGVGECMAYNPSRIIKSKASASAMHSWNHIVPEYGYCWFWYIINGPCMIFSGQWFNGQYFSLTQNPSYRLWRRSEMDPNSAVGPHPSKQPSQTSGSKHIQTLRKFSSGLKAVGLGSCITQPFLTSPKYPTSKPSF